MIAREIKSAPPKPKLRLIRRDDLAEPLPDTQALIDRMGRLSRIRWLRRAYDLKWLVDQHTARVPNLDCLDNDQIIALHQDMETARECITEDVPFADRGLIRDAFNQESP